MDKAAVEALKAHTQAMFTLSDSIDKLVFSIDYNLEMALTHGLTDVVSAIRENGDLLEQASR